MPTLSILEPPQSDPIDLRTAGANNEHIFIHKVLQIMTFLSYFSWGWTTRQRKLDLTLYNISF